MLKLPKELENISIEVKRKRIRNIIFKIKDDGILAISIPWHVSYKYIEKLLVIRKDWILENIKKLKNMSDEKIKYINGDILNIFDKKFLLEVVESQKDNVLFKDDRLYLFTSRIDDRDYKKKIIDYWYREQGKIILKEMLEKWLLITNKSINKLTIKTLKRNWGSCEVGKKNINLNSELLKQDRRFVEYVILHEIAHLEHPNHSKNFYNYVARFMPDWKERKKLGKLEI